MRFKDFIVPNIPAYTVSVSLAVLGVGCGMVPYITCTVFLCVWQKAELPLQKCRLM